MSYSVYETTTKGNGFQDSQCLRWQKSAKILLNSFYKIMSHYVEKMVTLKNGKLSALIVPELTVHFQVCKLFHTKSPSHWDCHVDKK